MTEIVGGAGLGIADIEYDERRGVLMLTTGLSMFDVDLSSGVMTEHNSDRSGDRYLSLGSGGDVLSASIDSLFRYDVESARTKSFATRPTTIRSSFGRTGESTSFRMIRTT